MEPDAQERQRLAELYARMSDGELEQLSDDADSLTETAAEALRSEIERRRLTSDAQDTSSGDRSPTSTEIIEFQKLIQIQQYRDFPEALIAKGILDSAGIECFLTDENIVRMDWFWSNVMGGVKLHVRPEDVDAALEILQQPAPETFEVEGIGQFEQPHCPSCDSMEIEFEELNKPVAFATTYLFVPIPLHRRGWKCHSCGHTWLAPDKS